MNNDLEYTAAVKIIKEAILRSRYRAVSLVNKELLSLYYSIGKYVSQNSRNEYWGKGAIEQISILLQKELPGLRGFSSTNIKNMRIFYEEWSPFIKHSLPEDDLNLTDQDGINRQLITAEIKLDENLLITEIRQLTTAEFQWNDFLQVGFTHHREILRYCTGIEARLFYIHECVKNFWSIEALKSQLRGDLYGKRGTILSNFTRTLPTEEQAKRAILSFKDEYLLDFVNIEDLDNPDERVIENEIVNNIKKFILSFGGKFCFIGNQYRVIVDEEEFFIDLLFFNRELHCLVAVELKRGKFMPSYLGQLNFYLSALDSQVKQVDEQPSIGIILCKEMKNNIVEFAVRDYNKPMGVATYRTQNEIPENLKKALPSIDDLKKLL